MIENSNSVVHDLFATIEDRRDQPFPGSYTAELLATGEARIAQKVGEEAVEVVVAALQQGPERLVEEAADLVYHLLVLLAANRVSWQDVEEALVRRRPAAPVSPELPKS